MKEFEQTLAKRLRDAIRKSFTPCPLIGPKWLRPCAKADAADYQFLGAPKLAKAIGKNTKYIAKIVFKNIDRKGIDADFALEDDGTITITQRKKEG